MNVRKQEYIQMRPYRNYCKYNFHILSWHPIIIPIAKNIYMEQRAMFKVIQNRKLCVENGDM